MGDKKRWVITTDGSRPMNEIEKELKIHDFSVQDIFSEIGCITGEATDAAVDDLRNIPGITDISHEPPSIDIGPPDSSFTW